MLNGIPHLFLLNEFFSVLSKIMEQIPMETTHMENKEVFYGFTKSKLCLTNLVAFCKGVASWWMREEQLMPSACTCAKYLTLFSVTSSSPSWRDMELAEGPLDGKGVGWRLHLKSCGQWPSVWVERVTSVLFQGLVFGLLPFNNFVSDIWRLEHTLREFVDDTQLCGASNRLQGRDAMQLDQDRHERRAHEVQQGQVQGPAPRLEQSQAQIQSGQWADWKQLCGEGLEGTSELNTEYDWAMCTFSP